MEGTTMDDLIALVDALVILNDDNLAQRVIDNNDVQRCLSELQDMLAADMEPVVRCKDCKYGDYDSKPDGAMVCLRTNDGFWRKESTDIQKRYNTYNELFWKVRAKRGNDTGN
jgi:hypothetical protein